ncbi:hypothetical protein OHA72_57270 [Dactylosporangium sp. NBC_01737]|uniref:hypothetical protein n=1 Tax=Dactylosporangium sp. NBC_01737 TaxID=2975959 RepID=UPI002E0F05EB|nr:hypothetical protein OHA72_57270 [Dactylosporangium sp. NBC_01737]
MRIVLGASDFGFGPISKLTAISRALAGHHRVLTGTTIRADFARINADAFDEVVAPRDSSPTALDGLILDSDYVISVMDADLVFRAVALGRPVFYVDSLFAFWQLRREPAAIAELCAKVRRAGFGTLEHHLGGLSPHERQYAAHLLADASAVQNFPGVPERLAEIQRVYDGRIHLTGSIVDEQSLAVAAGSGAGPDLLLSLGGYKNFLLDFDHNNEYLRLIARWMSDLLADWPRFERVVACSGGFAGDRAGSVSVGDRRADLTCLAQPAFMRFLASARHCMLTPGLTAIHEATVLDRFPMALPEEHYGHIVNLAGLRGTLFAKCGSRFADMVDNYAVPDHDYQGTAAIIAQVAPLLTDDAAYRRFRRGMNERIEAFVALSADERATGAAELRSLFHGERFTELLGRLLPVGATARSTS